MTMREVGRLILPEVAELLKTSSPDDIREAVSELHPADLAEVLDEIPPEDGARLIETLEVEPAARVFEMCEEDVQVAIIDHVGRERLGELVGEMSNDDRVDVLKALSEGDRSAIIRLVPEEERADIKELIAHPEETAGALMTTEFALASATWTAAETIEHLREVGQDFETIYWLYVKDAEDRLRGVVSLRDVVLAKPDERIENIMERDIISVGVDEDQEAVAAVFEKYDLFAVPVVDGDGKLLGIVTADDVLDVVVEEATEDIYKLAAVGEPSDREYLDVSVLAIARQRGVWLLLLLVTGFLSALLLQLYEDVRMAVPALIPFLPFLMGTGGNAGTQAATVVVRGLGTGDVETRDLAAVLLKEALVGIALGTGLGLLAAGWVMLTGRGPWVAMTVGVAMLLAAIVATSSGAFLPILFRKMGLDPALMSGPFITTIVDVAIIVLYFELGRRVLIGVAGADGG